MHIFKLIFITIFLVHSLHARLAVITEPVVEGFTVSALKYGPSVQSVHQKLDYIPSKKRPTPRSCQLLFNTVVNTLKETANEAMIEVEHLFYDIEADGSYKNHFWIPKKSLLFFEHVNANTLQSFPQPLSACTSRWQHPDVLVLTLPWQPSIGHVMYSVGTRFVRAPLHDTATTYGIFMRHPHHKHTQLESIPKTHALIEGSIPKAQKRKTMINIIKGWIDYAELHDATIPYVWGGSSFALTQPHKKPLIGFDCSSLIIRAAQIVGIPLAAKTSMMMEKTLKPLSKKDKLEVGDIIWRPGHVIIVSDVERNEIIQARGYESGYGCVYRSQLSEYFKGITTFKQLLNRYFCNQEVRELKKNGDTFNDTTQIKILKLPTQ